MPIIDILIKVSNDPLDHPMKYYFCLASVRIFSYRNKVLFSVVFLKIETKFPTRQVHHLFLFMPYEVRLIFESEALHHLYLLIIRHQGT